MADHDGAASVVLQSIFQGAQGYDATIVSGEGIMERGQYTGATPGKLIRGTQPRPAAAA